MSTLNLPLWIDDFEAHLLDSMETTLATGARVRLWAAACRRSGTLPDDEDWLARRAGLTNEQWKEVRGYLLPSWKHSQARHVYIIRRIQAEVARQEQETERARKAGRASAAKRKSQAGRAESNTRSTTVQHNTPSSVEHPLSKCSTSPPPPPPPPPPKTKTKTEGTPPTPSPLPPEIPPAPPARRVCRPMPPGFDRFWTAYPRRENRVMAEAAWKKLGPDPPLQEILTALAWQKRTEQWQRGAIPHASTYLNQRRWTDEPPTHSPPRRGQGLADWVRENQDDPSIQEALRGDEG